MAAVNRAGVVFPALLSKVVKDLISLELSDYVQPTSRDLRDAMYVRMYQSAVAMGIIAAGQPLVMVDFLRAVSKIDVDSENYAGPVADDGHKWAGVRIARTLFVVFQSIHHPAAAFGPKQKDLLTFLTTEKPDGSDHPLVAEYAALLEAGFGHDKDRIGIPITLEKDGDEADFLEMLIPEEIAMHDTEGFRTWLKAPWGGSGGKKKKKKSRKVPEGGGDGSGGKGGAPGKGGGDPAGKGKMPPSTPAPAPPATAPDPGPASAAADPDTSEAASSGQGAKQEKRASKK